MIQGFLTLTINMLPNQGLTNNFIHLLDLAKDCGVSSFTILRYIFLRLSLMRLSLIFPVAGITFHVYLCLY